MNGLGLVTITELSTELCIYLTIDKCKECIGSCIKTSLGWFN
jgi:hypothetical protein